MSYSSEVLADSPLIYPRLGDAGLAAITATASSSNFFSEPSSGAFDGNSGTHWTTNGTSTGWLRAQLASTVVSTGYSIRRRDDIPARNATAWTFEGSNNASTWTTLDTQSGITWPTAGETKSFTFTNTTAYLYYRLNVTANGGNTYLSVTELSIVGVGVSPCVDSSGNSRNGTVAGGVLRGAPGAITGDSDKAYTFDGSTGKVDFAYGSYMDATSITVEAWVKTTTANAGAIWDRDKGLGLTSPRVWQFHLVAGKLRFVKIGGTGGDATATSVVSVDDGAWHHVAATYDGSNVVLYVDGAVDTTQSAAGSLSGQAAYMSLGVNNSASTGVSFFDGSIDEAAYYGTALSSTRLAAHYTAGAAAPPDGPLEVTFPSFTTDVAGTHTNPTLAGSLDASFPPFTVTADGVANVQAGLDATFPSFTVSASGEVTRLGTLDATFPALTFTAAGAVADVTTGALDAAFPAFTVALVGDVDDSVGTDTDNLANGRRRHAIAYVETDVAVTTRPANLRRGYDYDKAIALPAAVLDDGRPT